MTMVSRPVKARATRMASIVASEPELTKRHCGSLKAPARCSAMMMASSVGRPNWVPSGARFWMASTMSGWAWPWTMQP